MIQLLIVVACKHHIRHKSLVILALVFLSNAIYSPESYQIVVPEESLFVRSPLTGAGISTIFLSQPFFE